MFRRLIAPVLTLATVLFASVSLAKTYEEVYRQNFDDFSTYTNNCYSGSVASKLLGTTDVTPTALTPTVKMEAWDVPEAGSGTDGEKVISKQSRTKYDTTDASDYLLFYMYGELTDGMVYDLSKHTTGLEDYKVEFDYYLGPSYNTTSKKKVYYTGTNGLAIVGSSSTLATFTVLPASSSGTPVATLYSGDSYTPLAEGLSTGTVGSYDEDGKWFHIVITGDEANGVVMSVTQEDGTSVLDGVPISSEFQTVDKLFAHAGAVKNRHCFCLDEVVVSKVSTAKSYKTVYEQYFELFETYTNNCYSGSIESKLLGTTYSEQKALTPEVKTAEWDVPEAGSGTDGEKVISRQNRTKYDTKAASNYLLFYMYGELTDGMVYDLSKHTTGLEDYKVEFDYYLGPSYNTTSKKKVYYTGTNGLAIVGSSSTLATFTVLPASSSGTPVATLYSGDSYTPLAEGLSTGTVGSYDEDGKWFHIVITGDEANGVVMTVTQEDGTSVLDGVTISSEFQTVDKLFAHAGAVKNRHCFCFDDVKVMEALKPMTCVWTGDSDRYWDNKSNWTDEKGKPAESYPSENDVAVISKQNQIIILKPSLTFGTVKADATTKYLVAFTEVGQKLKLPSGAKNYSALAPFYAELSGSTYTCLSRNAAEFVWSVDAGRWTDLDNWRIADEVVPVYPSEIDIASFPAKAAGFTGYAVTLLDDCAAKTLKIDAPLSFSNAVMAAEMVCGKGTVTLPDSTGFKSLASTTLTVSNDLVVAAAESKAVSLGGAADGDSTGEANFHGKVTGSGVVNVLGAKTTLRGDWSAFGGVVNFNCSSFFLSDNCYGSANAVWNMTRDYTSSCIAEDDRDFTFGALNGKPKSTVHSGVMEVGALAYGSGLQASGTSELTGGELTYHTVRKVGGDTLTVKDIKVGHYDIAEGALLLANAAAIPTTSMMFNGGVLKFEDATIDPSSVIASSIGPISVDYGVTDKTNTWATALAMSNVGGLVKDGAGTLRLSAVPQYSGATVVSNGVLILPPSTSLGAVQLVGSGRLVVDMANASKNIMVFSATSSNVKLVDRLEFINLPAGYELNAVETGNNGVIFANGSSTRYWVGKSGGDWSYSGNWDPSGTPTAADATVFTNGYDIITTMVNTASSALSLTGNGDLCLGGSYNLTTFLKFDLSDNLVLDANPMSSSNDDADYYGVANRLSLLANTKFSAPTINGDGNITVVNCDLTVTPTDEYATNVFVGSITAPNFIKQGKGNFNFIGEGEIYNTIAVNEGTLRIGTYRDIEGFRMDFDASDVSSFTVEGKGITNWRSTDGKYNFGYESGQYASLSTEFFGGRNAMRLRPDTGDEDKFSRYLLSPNNGTSGVSSKSLFLVHEPVKIDQYAYLYAENSASTTHGLSVSTASKLTCNTSGYAEKGIFTGDSYESAKLVVGSPLLTFWSDNPMSADTGVSELLGTRSTGATSSGTGFDGAIGEVVSFTRTLSHPEREVVTKQLMRKWGLGYEDGGAIRSTTAVTMKYGATLDLAGQTMTAKSFTGAGVVTNGILTTASGVVTQSGGPLTYPAIDDYEYVITEVGQQLRITDGAGKKIKITVPRSAFKPGVTGRMSVYCEGMGEKDVEWSIGRAIQPIYEGNGWWTIPAGGFTLRLR